MEEEGLQVLNQYPFLSQKEGHKQYYKAENGGDNTQE